MKYCSKCNKVYPDGVECECIKKEPGYFKKKAEMMNLDCEPKCKCGSTENLTYHPVYKYSISGISDRPAYCECSACKEKSIRELARQESMKYLVFDYDQSENKLCEDKGEVEEFLKCHAENWEGETGKLNVLILKLEPMDRNSLKESDFKPQYKYGAEYGSGRYDREPNTHIVIWDEEVFRVDEVIVPAIEYDGSATVDW
mgnify:CR=1 FL=1